MITVIPRKLGTEPARLIDYLVSARREGAKLLLSNLAGSRLDGWADQIEGLARAHRPRQKAFVKHMILAFSPEDPVPEPVLREIAELYLERMGYAEAPYLVFLHLDRNHPHLHIVTTPTQWDGRPVSESFEWQRSMRVAREIERRWQLRAVPSPGPGGARKPDRRELGQAERTGELAPRQRFQRDLSEAALRSRSFEEFLERAAGAGYEVRARFDGQGRLHGLSFAKGELAFSGSHLGQDFRGTRFLEAFALEPDRRDEGPQGRGELASPRETPMAEPLRRPDDEISPSSPPSRRAETDLPAGRLHLAGVRPEALERASGRIESEDVYFVRKDWSKANIAASSDWLRERNRELHLLVRPEAGPTTTLAFRGVSGEQAQALAAQGLEPAWKVGLGQNRYDVVVRFSERLTEREERALRTLISERFELRPQAGVFVNAVHLPGSQVEGGEHAVLLELRTGAATASRAWIDEVRIGAERAAVEKLARELERDQKLNGREVDAFAELARQRPELPSTTWLKNLQNQIDQLRTQPGEQPVSMRLLENRDVVEAALRTQRELPHAPAEYAGEYDQRLLRYEAEIARRTHGALDLYQQAEVRRTQGVQAIEAAIERSQAPDSTAADVKAYRQALEGYPALEAEVREHGQRYAGWLHAQAQLDTARFGEAMRERLSWGAVEALEQSIEREVRLGRLAGAIEGPQLEKSRDPRVLEHHYAALSEHLKGLQGQLGRLPEQELTEIPNLLRERILTRQALASDQLQREPATRAHLAQAVGKRDSGEMLDSALSYRREQADRASYEAQLGRVATAAHDRLPEALRRVVVGGSSPEALRQLNGALVALDGAGAVRVVRDRDAGRPQEWVRRYERLEQEIRRDAATLLEKGEATPKAVRERLLANATEAVSLTQRLDRVQRELLKVADPGKAPTGVAPAAWQAAWAMRAVEKGLSPELAASQLGNLAQSGSIASSFVPGGKAFGVAVMTTRFAVGMAYRWAERVLSQ